MGFWRCPGRDFGEIGGPALDHLATIASRGPVADPLGFREMNTEPLFGKIECRRNAGKAAANHGDINLLDHLQAAPEAGQPHLLGTDRGRR